jgi:enoyl-CoA hydratase/carnithine racemase
MLDRIVHGDILELRLARPPVNALSPGLVHELREAIGNAPRQGFHGLILSGREGVYSGGLDVPELVRLDRPSMADFWDDFCGVMGALACSPIPTVAAITGHSPAGGAVIAMWCDYRIMATGDYRIGLNETQVGLAIPPMIIDGFKRLVGAHRGERLVAEGRLITAGEALQIGLVDELQEYPAIVPQALAWLRRHLALPRHAFLANRRIARADLGRLFEDDDMQSAQAFVEGWFSAPTQAALQALVAQLQARKKE